MKLSVVVPVFNKAPFLEECFASILASAVPEMEVIIVDDRSTDESLALLRGMTDPRIKVVALEKNLGPAGAAQRAMDLAQGEYMARVDADDVIMPGRFAKQIAFMDANRSIGASGGQILLMGSETGVWNYPVGWEACRAELLFNLPVNQGASILRSSVLREHNIRFEDHWPRIGEDWLFWVRMSQHTEFDNLDLPLIRYRRGSQNSGFGMDQASYREPNIIEVFRMLGVPITAHQAELHLMTFHTFKTKPDRQVIREFRGWLDHLLLWNEKETRFPEPAFSDRIERSWEHLFHFLVDHGAAPALEHFKRSPRKNINDLLYLLKVLVNERIGRRPE